MRRSVDAIDVTFASGPRAVVMAGNDGPAPRGTGRIAVAVLPAP